MVLAVAAATLVLRCADKTSSPWIGSVHRSVGALVYTTPKDPLHRCTATLVSATRAITAAHCLRGEESRLAFVLGRRAGRPDLIVPVKGIRRHPHFHAPSGPGLSDCHDVALLELEHDPTLDGRSLAVGVGGLRRDTSLILVSYGATRERAQGWRHEQTVRLDRMGKSEFIVVADSADGAICAGDSGGALIAADRDHHPVVVGLISRKAPRWGKRRRCGPAIAERLSAARDFNRARETHVSTPRTSAWARRFR